jgi:Calcineurin-like phosphoesterase superfamily domain
MRIGILADIHEDVAKLALALQHFRREAVDQVLVLGDVFDTGQQLHEAVALLAGAGAVGVWGNHDLGLCFEPEERVRERYAGPIFDFMQTLRPRLEVADCLFSHGLPYWDATDPVVYYLGERPETAAGRARSFEVADHAAYVVGHFHRWLAATPEGPLNWDGHSPLLLQPGQRHLVVVAAVCNGWCAMLDTDRRSLEPVCLLTSEIRRQK